MIRIVVGGQLAKDEIVAAVQKCGGDQVQVTKKGDMQAAMDIKSGAAPARRAAAALLPWPLPCAVTTTA